MSEETSIPDQPSLPRHLAPLRDQAPIDRPYALLDRICHDMLRAVFSQDLHDELDSNKPVVVVLKPIDLSWVYPFEELLRSVYPKARIIARRGTEVASKRAIEVDVLPDIFSGAVIGVSHDPAALLPPLLVSGADAHYELGHPSRASVEAQIIEMTGTVPRALKQADIDALSAPELIAAMRPARSGGTVARRIAKLATEKQQDSNPLEVPRLAELALPADMDAWTMDVVTALKSKDPVGLEPTLVSGRAGTGKTMLMRSLAAAAEVPLVATDAAQWHVSGNGHLNDVLREIEGFFSTLRAKAPCIGVVDEVDSIPNRAVLSGSYDPWWVSMTNAFLTQLDRLVATQAPVLLVGITNLPGRLDAALIRPGRLGRHLALSPPTSAEQRAKMLRLHLPPHLKGADLSRLLPDLTVQTQAELGQIARSAKVLAEREKCALTIDHLQAVLRPADTRPEPLRWTVAVHEAGHALMAVLLGRHVQFVSALRRPNHAEGSTHIADDPSGVKTLSTIEDDVRIRMAGRAADMLVGLGANTGAADDIVRANALLADAYLTFWMAGAPTGLGSRIGGANLEQRRAFVEERIADLLTDTLERLSSHRSALTLMAEALLEKGVLSTNELQDLLLPLGLVVPGPEVDEEQRP